ncbi:MAG TPA: hypothetical protein VG817_05880 [Gemmatimonadales bacterium]|nr:hypothetical protein [Gemmatimonadales bacterium]
MTLGPLHLDPEELDLLLEGSLPADRTSHLETCEECRTAAEETREVVFQLASLARVAPAAAFADRVMARVGMTADEHLDGQDLDQWVEGLLPAPRELHLRSCPECQALADQERMLVMRLQALPLFNPATGFNERVMARVELPVTSLAGAWHAWKNRTFMSPERVAIAAGLGIMLGGSLAGSAAWASTHQDQIMGASSWFLAEGKYWLLQGLATIEAQPWYQAIRGALTPARIAAVATVGVALYAAGVLALRRLMALPSAQVARALP